MLAALKLQSAEVTVCVWVCGGQGVNRTLDTRIFSPLLYRLSYLPTVTAVQSAGDACSERSFVSSRPVACNRRKKRRRFHLLRFWKCVDLRNPWTSRVPT